MENRIVQCLCVGSIQTNCWIYVNESSNFCAVIDPGAEPGVIISHLKKHGLKPDYILMTHGHFDHITALPDLLNVFESVSAIHKDDASCLKQKPGRLLDDNDTIGPFRVIHVPGHTPGCVAFYDEEGGLLFTGDTLFCADCGRTDLAGGSQEQLENSLKKLLSMKGNIRVLPGHGPETTIKQEAARGIGFFVD